MKPSTIEVWLWLLLVMCPYNRKTTELLEHFDSAEELACAIRDGNCPGLSEAEKQRARNIRSREVGQIMQECAQNDIRIITLDDPEYPTLLKTSTRRLSCFLYAVRSCALKRGFPRRGRSPAPIGLRPQSRPNAVQRSCAARNCAGERSGCGDRRDSALLRGGAWNSNHRSTRLRPACELPRRK